MAGPNPLRVLWSMLMALRLDPPTPSGTETFDHSSLQPVLEAIGNGGVDRLVSVADELGAYLERAETIEPDSLSRPEALAYWINLYNALALDLARRTRQEGHQSVLDLHDGFSAPVAAVAGEELSLDGIEHGKIRRFGDPRIHAALVCGSLSCPTLRHEPFDGATIDDQLDDQMRYFLAAGGAHLDAASGTIELSRVLLWFGADFVRPHRMPTFLPAPRRSVLRAVSRWLSEDDAGWVRATTPRIRFMDYDWSLGCSIRRPGPA